MTVTLHRCTSDDTDEDLVPLAQAGDVAALEALVRRYRGFARAKARSYFLVGADADDIEQEGLIGLYKSVRDFRDDRESSFRAFADLCITRQVISAIKAATRNKHRPLNQYVSMSGRVADDGRAERSPDDFLDLRCLDPADEVIGQERLAALFKTMAENLSPLEVEVLRLYVEGRSYQEISAGLGRSTKSIDNAIQRIKRKLDAHLHDDDEGTLALAS